MKPREITLFLCAVQFLSRVPMPAIAGFDAAWINRSAKYFPLVGQMVGGLCAAVLLAAAKVWAGWVPVVLALTAGVLVTGALHEDGLADTTDGLGGGGDRDRRLAIMKDSRLGVYGALAVGLCLAIKSAVLASLTVHTAALLLIAIHGGGRAAAVVAMNTMAYGGNADTAKIKTVTDSVTRAECLIAVAFALWPLLFLNPRQALAGLAFGSLAAIMPAYAAKRLIGGHTGDILGAIEQMFEVGFLLGATAAV